jgi:hypothetical protein
MKEEAQGFPTAWGSTPVGFPLHPKGLGVSENEFIFGKSKLTMGIITTSGIFGVDIGTDKGNPKNEGGTSCEPKKTRGPFAMVTN